MSNNDQVYLNEKAVSELTGFALSTLRNNRFNRVGIRFRKVGPKAVRYKLSDVLEFMDATVVETDQVVS